MVERIDLESKRKELKEMEANYLAEKGENCYQEMIENIRKVGHTDMRELSRSFEGKYESSAIGFAIRRIYGNDVPKDIVVEPWGMSDACIRTIEFIEKAKPEENAHA